MDKLKEIKELIGALEIGQLLDFDNDYALTPFGRFISRLEYILQRDDETIEEIKYLFNSKR